MYMSSNKIYEAKAEATGVAYTNTGDKVTSTSSATATSNISYNDALSKARKTAEKVANSVAKNDANIINQSVFIAEKNNADTVLLKYFTDLTALNNFQLPTPTINDPQFYNIVTNIPNYSGLGGGITVYTSLNTIVFDNNYENIYVGGLFTEVTQADGTLLTVQNVARWNISGQMWYTVGTDGLDGEVFILAFDSNNTLYAGGAFTGNVAVYTNLWNTVGTTTIGGDCYSLVFDSNGILYAGGGFTDYVASFDNSTQTWTPIGTGTGLDNIVRCLIFDINNTLYAGGDFSNYIAKYDGSTWSSLGDGLNNSVYSLAYDSDNNILYAGGSFTATQYSVINPSINLNHIAQWNIGTQLWSALGVTVVAIATIKSLVFNNGNLYIGSRITDAALCYGSYLVKWDGSTFSSVGPATLGEISSIAIDNKNDIYLLMISTQIAGNATINNIFEITGLQIINNDGSVLDLGQKIYAAQQTQSNLLVYNKTKGKWQIT